MNTSHNESPSSHWLEELTLEAAQRREVFARFGLAMYHAQCVERQLGILLATTLNPEFMKTSSDARECFFEREFKKTLGQMLKTIRSRINVRKALDARLAKALELRNWLAHEYFWQRPREIISLQGRDKMILELQEAANFLDDVDKELSTISERWIKKLGFTDKQLESELEKYKESNDVL